MVSHMTKQAIFSNSAPQPLTPPPSFSLPPPLLFTPPPSLYPPSFSLPPSSLPPLLTSPLSHLLTPLLHTPSLPLLSPSASYTHSLPPFSPFLIPTPPCSGNGPGMNWEQGGNEPGLPKDSWEWTGIEGIDQEFTRNGG
jgi:hypothetical protein